MENFDNEQWRDIDGYDGMYQVSDLGRVRSRKSGEWKMMKGGKNNKGYLNVILSKDGNVKCFLIHRLVANAFIHNYDESKTVINHINEIKTDNKVENLEWCTISYNNAYNGLRKRQYHPQPKRDKIRPLYNPEISIKENIAIFKEQGIECGKRTISQLRQDLNLKHSKPVRDKIKDMYNPDLSIADNIELFKTNGVECGRNTVWKLRKDLGLTNNKRDNLKPLYNPNLSYKDNIELFNENGIDCSKKTIERLRKDLGLIKH